MSARLSFLAAAACFLVPPLVAQAAPTRIIECGTDSRQRAQCDAGGQVVTARLVRDLSSRRCGPRGSWGWTDKIVWADNGCRGQFEVTYRRLPGSEGTRRITCGTLTTQQVTCKTEGDASNVQLVREISRNRCRKGSNWGNTNSFIWAKNGCRAEFEVTYSEAATPPPTPAPNTRVITCGTLSGSQVTCKTEGYAAGVRLVRDVSNNRCRKGTSWGNTDSFIWANKGCRGEFEVTYRESAGMAPITRRITCGTTSNTQVQCNVGSDATDVSLVRDLSANRCRQGYNWGHVGAIIWANRGCRAEFEVTYRGGGLPNRPSPVPAPTKVITCGDARGSAMSCNAFGTVANMRLQRDRSGGRCNQSSAWGLDGESIWVARGCYGDFELTYTKPGQQP